MINLICFVLANLHFKFSLRKYLSSFYVTNPYLIKRQEKNEDIENCKILCIYLLLALTHLLYQII
jgi:hypothetical protein